MVCTMLTVGHIAVVAGAAFAFFPVSMSIVRTVKRMSFKATPAPLTA